MPRINAALAAQPAPPPPPCVFSTPDNATCPEFIRWGGHKISGNMYCVHRDPYLAPYLAPYLTLYLSLGRRAGNLYCVHRDRAAALNHALNAHALHAFAGRRRGHEARDALLGVPQGVSFTPGRGFGGDSTRLGEWGRYYGRNATSGERRWSNPLVTH